MEKRFTLIFDDIILKQLKQAAKNQSIKEILSKMLDKIEIFGPRAGELLDSQLALYEVKKKHPPLRLYYKYNESTSEIYVFEYEMKTSVEKQQKTIQRIKIKLLKS